MKLRNIIINEGNDWEMSSIGQKQTWEPSKSLKSGSSPRCFDRSPCLSGVVELLALGAKVVKGIFLSQSTACPLVVTVGAVICVLHNHSHTWSPASFFKYQFCRMFNWSFFYILLSFWIAHFLIAGRTRDNLPSLASAPLPDWWDQ